ncbi:MAG: hypothetical protein ACRDEB_07645, partial [Chitinophagaceae bacterium]
MKKLILPFLLLSITNIIYAQPGKQVTKPATKPVAKPGSILKTNADSVSYVLGEVTAFSLIERGLGEVKITNTTAFMKALNDILGKKPTLLNDVVANA